MAEGWMAERLRSGGHQPSPSSIAISHQPSAMCVLLTVLVCGAAACAPKAVAPATPPPPTPAQRLASADALVRAGCYDCLLDAYGEYDLLRQFAYARDAATLGAIRTAGLIARRQ